MKAAIFLAPSFLKDLLKPKWQKEIRSITREALLALEKQKCLASSAETALGKKKTVCPSFA